MNLDPDGYQYGVRFSDGSVRASWNGASQRLRAMEFLEHVRIAYPGDAHRMSLVRRVGRRGPWEEA